MLKKILVTGSSGTIGTRLCEKLIQEGFEISCVDIAPNKWNKEVNSRTFLFDLRKKDFFDVLPSFDLVVHLAANARVYNLVVDPSLSLDNVITTYNVLEFCRKKGVKKILFASSREIYGNAETEKRKEIDVKIDDCESPYTASKISGEAFVRSYHKCYGLDFIITRFSNVYGMYDESDRVIPLFIRNSLEGKDLLVFGKDKKLDFTYIDDTISGLIVLIKNFDNVKNQSYNIASGEAHTILEVAEFIKKLTNSKSKIKFSNNRKGEVIKFVADISKAKSIGYSPKTTFEEGLKLSVNWYVNALKK
ncbi:MAG: NAD-dependent epimerase/dehydratase family protein [Candidatus Diapherotrites archaeon]